MSNITSSDTLRISHKYESEFNKRKYHHKILGEPSTGSNLYTTAIGLNLRLSLLLVIYWRLYRQKSDGNVVAL